MSTPGLALSIPTETASRILKAWLSGKTSDTIRNYGLDLHRFARFVGAVDLNGAAAALFSSHLGAANALVFDYREKLLQEGLAPASINRHLAALKSLTKIARMLGVVSWALEVPRLRAESYRDTRGPGTEGFRLLMAELEKRTGPKAVRDCLVLRLLYERGLRIKEVLGIQLDGVDLARGRIAILGKMRGSREWVTLAPTTVEALRQWLEVRGGAPGPLIVRVHRRGLRNDLAPLSRQGGYRLVRLLGEAVGVHARPHGLRHAAITAALDAGADIRAVQRFSRHRNLNTLMLYDDNRRDLGGEVAQLIAEPINFAERARQARQEKRRRAVLDLASFMSHPATVPMPEGLRVRA